VDDKGKNHLEVEGRLKDFIRFTDTYEMLDTLTVTEAFVSDSNTFFSLLKEITNDQFLTMPFE